MAGRLFSGKLRFWSDCCGAATSSFSHRRLVTAQNRETPDGGPPQEFCRCATACLHQPNHVETRHALDAPATNGLKNLLGFIEQRELLLCVLKLPRMHAAPRTPMLHGKSQVEHLMEQYVFHG